MLHGNLALWSAQTHLLEMQTNLEIRALGVKNIYNIIPANMMVACCHFTAGDVAALLRRHLCLQLFTVNTGAVTVFGAIVPLVSSSKDLAT